MDQFSEKLKYHLAPDSPALKDLKKKGDSHYCMPATAGAVTGTVVEKGGKKFRVLVEIEAKDEKK